jgi:hypothetical protein
MQFPGKGTLGTGVLGNISWGSWQIFHGVYDAGKRADANPGVFRFLECMREKAIGKLMAVSKRVNLPMAGEACR